MDDPNSRYARSGQLTWTAPDGSAVPYLERRFLPQGPWDTLVQVTVQQGDRLDLLANRWLGNAEAWWRIADGTNALHPTEPVARPGETLIIPVPRF